VYASGLISQPFFRQVDKQVSAAGKVERTRMWNTEFYLTCIQMQILLDVFTSFFTMSRKNEPLYFSISLVKLFQYLRFWAVLRQLSFNTTAFKCLNARTVREYTTLWNMRTQNYGWAPYQFSCTVKCFF